MPPPEPTEVLPQDIPLDVRFEDAHLIVVNKPPGMVVSHYLWHRFCSEIVFELSSSLVFLLLFTDSIRLFRKKNV